MIVGPFTCGNTHVVSNYRLGILDQQLCLQVVLSAILKTMGANDIGEMGQMSSRCNSWQQELLTVKVNWRFQISNGYYWLYKNK